MDVIFYMPERIIEHPYLGHPDLVIAFDMPTFAYRENMHEGQAALIFELTPDSVKWMLDVAEHYTQGSVALETSSSPDAVKAHIQYRYVWA